MGSARLPQVLCAHFASRLLYKVLFIHSVTHPADVYRVLTICQALIVLGTEDTVFSKTHWCSLFEELIFQLGVTDNKVKFREGTRGQEQRWRVPRRVEFEIGWSERAFLRGRPFSKVQRKWGGWLVGIWWGRTSWTEKQQVQRPWGATLPGVFVE